VAAHVRQAGAIIVDCASNETSSDHLIALAAAFDRDDVQVSSLVRKAVEDPAAYVSEHKHTLRLRGINAPVPRLPWLALLDALVESSFAVELDWRETPSAALEQISALRIVPTGERVRDIPGPDFELGASWSLTDAIRAAATTLADVGIDLLVLDLQTDSFPMLCARPSTTEELRILAERTQTFLHRAKHLTDRSAPC
jgi:hypothetical protein